MRVRRADKRVVPCRTTSTCSRRTPHQRKHQSPRQGSSPSRRTRTTSSQKSSARRSGWRPSSRSPRRRQPRRLPHRTRLRPLRPRHSTRLRCRLRSPVRVCARRPFVLRPCTYLADIIDLMHCTTPTLLALSPIHPHSGVMQNCSRWERRSLGNFASAVNASAGKRPDKTNPSYAIFELSAASTFVNVTVRYIRMTLARF